MTWEHYTIIALWVLGACASAAVLGLRAPRRIGIVGAICFLTIWPGLVIFGVCAGLWERLTTPPWARRLD